MENEKTQMLTDEDLDNILVAGSKAMRGVELRPDKTEGSIWRDLHPDLRAQFTKGTVMPTDYSHVDEKGGKGIALARLFLKITGA